MGTKRKKKPFKKKNIDLKKAVLDFFEKSPNKDYTVKQIAYRLGLIKKKDREILQNLINFFVADGSIIEPKPWKYKAAPFIDKSIEGIIETTKHGYGFVASDSLNEEVFIPPKKTAHALNGDHVKVVLQRHKRRKKVEGEVVEVIERARTEFVGVLQVSEKFAFFIPDNTKIHVDFFIPPNMLSNGQNKDKVVIKFTDWPKNAKNPFGKVIKVLGKAGTKEVEMNALIAEFNLPFEFPQNVLNKVEEISQKIPQKEYSKRKDFRNVCTFTIDPHDAKDFDDAISIRKLKDNLWEIGIHIADVTFYLKTGSVIDKEALKRATSVYFVDQVIPMLPEKLSNFLCSLRPNEEKLCYSAVFEIDNNANVLKEWFGRTIIRSNRRFTYDEVQEIIETEKGEFAEEILVSNDLATKLRNKRFENGSFSFETEEVKFELDAKGKPLEITKYKRKAAHMLVEDFMLLANNKVAELLFKSGKENYPSIYRTHDSPDLDKLINYQRIAKQFGHHVDLSSNEKVAKSFNKILKEIDGKPEQNFLQTLAIRSMTKALYTPKELGHYGLAYEHYTHFTSPIRRYPDVMVHRVLDDYLTKRKPKYSNEKLTFISKHCSAKEISAENAERASIKYMQVEFMQDKINQEFECVISGVAEFGLFVEIIENKCEGLVAMQSLEDDYYVLDEENYQLKGNNYGKIYKLGELVTTRLIAANLIKRILDFVLVEDV